jgi:hypothetical protein
MIEISPLKTPIRSIVRPMEPGSITPSAIEELSSQIDSLIQRGRRLRDLKNSMSRSPNGKSFQETQSSIYNALSLPEAVDCDSGPLEDIMAVINASDPLFIEDARVPPQATKDSDPQTIMSNPAPAEVGERPRFSIEKPCSYSIRSSGLTSEGLSLRLRTRSEVSNSRVFGDTSSDVAVEAWRGSDLVGIGRKSPFVSDVPGSCVVDVWDVWEGSVLGKVTLEIHDDCDVRMKELPCASSETITTSINKPPVTKPIEILDDLKKSLITSLSQCSVGSQIKPPLAEKSIQSSPRKLPRDLTTVRTSSESIVSFLSESPNKQEEELRVSDDGSELDFNSKSTFSSLFEDKKLASIEAELAMAGDLREVLQKKMLELDIITQRLTGEEPSQAREPMISPVEAKEVNDSRALSMVDAPVHGKSRIRKARMSSRRRRRRDVVRYSSLIPEPSQSSEVSSLGNIETPAIPANDVPEMNETSEDLTDQPISSLSYSNSISMLPPKTANLSVVRSSLVAIASGPKVVIEPTKPLVKPPLVSFEASSVRLSSKRKESIEKARKTISSLRKSFLKDADRMRSAIPSDDADEE